MLNIRDVLPIVVEIDRGRPLALKQDYIKICSPWWFLSLAKKFRIKNKNVVNNLLTNRCLLLIDVKKKRKNNIF